MTTIPDLPDLCWPVDTSCVDGWDDYDAGARARAVALAGQTLRVLTLFQVGGCPVVVRPASQGCRDRTWRTYPVTGPGALPWAPVSVGGSWLNIGCGHTGGCGCLGAREVRLYGPASTVSEVKVDGVVLDPSAYRLDPGGLLVRLDAGTWPLCQDLALPDTEEGTWSVTYIPGAPVDGLGAYAAGVLAGEFVKACSGGDCRLPSGVTQIARQGVTLTLTPGSFPGGRTGIKEVDAYLARWNPNGMSSPPAVYSPGIRRPRRMAAPVIPVPPSGDLDGGGALLPPDTPILDGGGA